MERRAELVDQNKSGVMSFVESACFASAYACHMHTDMSVAGSSAAHHHTADAYHQLLHTKKYTPWPSWACQQRQSSS